MPIPSVLLFKHCFSTISPAAVNGGALPIDLVELGSNMITTDGFEDLNGGHCDEPFNDAEERRAGHQGRQGVERH